MALCRVEISNIYVDQNTGSPVVILEDPQSGNMLPILIAPLEASLIAIELEGKKPIRPLSHDLMLNILKELNWSVESIIVDDLKNNIFYAKLVLFSDIGRVEVDSRPSDAIALALRAKAPIYVRKKVFALALGIENIAKGIDKDMLKDLLEDLEIDDVGGKIM